MADDFTIIPLHSESRPLTAEELEWIETLKITARFDDGLYRAGKNGWERVVDGA